MITLNKTAYQLLMYFQSSMECNHGNGYFEFILSKVLLSNRTSHESKNEDSRENLKENRSILQISSLRVS